MRKEWQRTISEFTAIVLFISLAFLKKNGQSAGIIMLYTLILITGALGIILLLRTKSFWQKFGYSFTTAEVTGIEVLQRYGGRLFFLIKPGTSESKLLAVSLRYINNENNEVDTVANIWQKKLVPILGGYRN